MVVIQGGKCHLVIKMMVAVSLERWSFNRVEIKRKYYGCSQDGRNNEVSIIYCNTGGHKDRFDCI